VKDTLGEGPRKFNAPAALALAALSGVMHGACFPRPGLWPLAFVALGPLVAAVRGRAAGAAFALGWVEGTIASSIAVVPWIAAAARDYFEMGPGRAWLFGALTGQIFGAITFAIFAAAAARLGRLRSPSGRVLAMAAAWTALELLRARAFTGAPWDLLAHALYTRPVFIQAADLGGAFLVSFVLAASCVAVGEAIVASRREKIVALATAALLVALDAGYGAWRLRAIDDAAGPSVRVALVQGNVPNRWRSDPMRFDDAFRAFTEPTREVLREKPDLVVWPENAVSFLLAPNPRFTRTLAAILGPEGPPLLLGGPRYESAHGRARFYNAAYLVSPRGAMLTFYDKRHLAPFAEYSPLGRLPWIGWRFDAPGDYTAGARPGIFSAAGGFGVLICFEVIYPELSRDLARSGARFLLNLSNDAWFGTSAGLEQHFAMSVLRAVETRRALARATNTGISALVAPSGRIAARFPEHVRGGWIVRVPLRDGRTPYMRAGDVFAFSSALAAAAALLFAPRRS